MEVERQELRGRLKMETEGSRQDSRAEMGNQTPKRNGGLSER